MSWIYNDLPFDEDEIKNNFGFVYLITNISNGKKYIGKKQFYFKKTKSVKGKKKRILVDSDWRDYWSSSDILKEEVTNTGQENFHRTILRLCKTKSECSYWELKYQIEYDVLLKPDEFYNEWVSCRIRRSHLIKKS